MAKVILTSEKLGLSSEELASQFPDIGANREPGSNGLNPAFAYIPVKQTYAVKEMNGNKYATVVMKKVSDKKAAEAEISVQNFTKFVAVDGQNKHLMDISAIADMNQATDGARAICDAMIEAKENLMIVSNGSVMGQGAYDTAPKLYQLFKVVKASKAVLDLSIVK